ncbi:MAG: hypothetical protein HWN81_12190 [Candidatus Lokiarchaeota archaeon]|nr:hypothetical protein [Candidatus Lokiarchaeota archaeon]
MNILIPFMGIDPPVENQPRLVSDFDKGIEKLKNELLNNKNNQKKENNT